MRVSEVGHRYLALGRRQGKIVACNYIRDGTRILNQVETHGSRSLFPNYNEAETLARTHPNISMQPDFRKKIMNRIVARKHLDTASSSSASSGLERALMKLFFKFEENRQFLGMSKIPQNSGFSLKTLSANCARNIGPHTKLTQVQRTIMGTVYHNFHLAGQVFPPQIGMV